MAGCVYGLIDQQSKKVAAFNEVITWFEKGKADIVVQVKSSILLPNQSVTTNDTKYNEYATNNYIKFTMVNCFSC